MPTKILKPILRRTLRPLVRLVHQAGFERSEFVHLAQELFDEIEKSEANRPSLEIAAELSGSAQGLSTHRSSSPAGLTATTSSDPALSVIPESVVIYGWHEDPEFVDENGKPLALPFETGEKTFCDLVSRYAAELDPKAVRRSLEECNAISVTTSGKLRLSTRTLLSKPGPDRLHRAISRPLRALLLNLENNNPLDTSDYDPKNS